MALLELCIGKSKYTIDCEESERLKITTLASRVNERVNNLNLKMHSVNEKTILMLCAVMIEEDLEAAKKLNIDTSIQNNQDNNSTENHFQLNDPSKETEKIMVKTIDDVSNHIENLANKIKNC